MSTRIVLAGTTPVNRRTHLQIAERLLKKHPDGIDFIAPVNNLTDSSLTQSVEILASWVEKKAEEGAALRMFFIVPPNTGAAEEDSIVAEMGSLAIVKEAKVDKDSQFPAIVEAAVKYARKGTEDVVAIVWDEEDEEAGVALSTAVAREVEARDLTNGFTVLTTGDDDEDDEGEAGTDDEEPEDEPVVEEKPKPAPRKTAAPPKKVEHPSEEEIVAAAMAKYRDLLEAASADLVETLSKTVATAALEILIARSDAMDES